MTETQSQYAGRTSAKAELKTGKYLVAYRIDEEDLYAIQNITTRQIILANLSMLTNIKQAIRGVNPAELFSDGTTLQGLQAGGFVLPSSVSELEVIRMEEMKNRFSFTDYMDTWIAPTYDCNMSCLYCAQRHIKQSNVVMGKEVQNAILAFLESTFPRKKTATFCWYGGEPLLAPQVIEDLGMKIQSLAKTYSVRTSHRIITNGTLLSESTVQILEALNVASAQITVDTLQHYHDVQRSLKNGTGTWSTILNNVEKYCERIPIKLRVNLSRENSAYMNAFLDLLDSRGILGRVHISPAIASCFEGYNYVDSDSYSVGEEIDPSEFEDIVIRLMEDVKLAGKIGALAYRGILIPTNFVQCTAKLPDCFVIGPRGEMYKCAVLFGDPEEEVGSVFSKSGPDKALESRFLGHDVSGDALCVECLAYPACRGGCLVSRFKSSDLRNRCFISIPRWEKVLRQQLKEITGKAPQQLTFIPLYSIERRLGYRITASAD